MEPGMSSMNFIQNGPERSNMNGNSMGSRRNGANQQGSYYIIQRPDDFSGMFTDQVENHENQSRPRTSQFGIRSPGQQRMGGDVGRQALQFADQPQNMMQGGMTRMMSAVGAGDGSAATNVGAGRSGAQRQYRVLVVDGDHEILRGLNLPGMETDSGVAGKV